jgi:hypothetical protein
MVSGVAVDGLDLGAGEHQTALVMRGTGAHYLARVGTSGPYTLLWVSDAVSDDQLTSLFLTSAAPANLSFDSWKVTDLPAPWDTDYGIATQRLAGSVVAGTTFTHEANCLIEWTQTTLSTGSGVRVLFRKQDLSNYWRVGISNAGDLTLVERVADVDTTRATAAGIVAAGHRIVVIADGAVIRGYSNNVLRWTYNSATNFATATAGEVNVLGTGGVVSDVISWPRVLSGAALSTLNAV